MTEPTITLEISTVALLVIGAINLIVLGPLAWIIKGAIHDLRDLQREHHEFKDNVHTQYVRHDNYQHDLGKLERLIEGLYEGIKT